jgi:hypothetical protein
MANTDLFFPVTAKQIGPGGTVLSRPKVFYVKSSEIGRMSPDTVRNATALFLVDRNRRKVVAYELPDEVLAMQALSQGATAAIVFSKHYQDLAPTSSATAADRTVASKYYNQITTINGGFVKLPDPMSRRIAVVVNGLTGPISIYPNGPTSSATANQQNRIDGATGAYVIGAGERIHFVAPTASTAGAVSLWRTAADVGA